MPILGLVLTLEDATAVTQSRVDEALAGMRDIDPGEPAAHRWPVVLDAKTEAEAQVRIDSLLRVIGVAGVDVVYADFEDLLTRSTESNAREDV
jgi:hypothetical protein